MSNQQTTIQRLNKKAKIGWACYFAERDANLSTIQNLHDKIADLSSKLQQQSSIESVPVFLQNEIKELYTIINKELECPICLDTIAKDDLVFSNCGHKYCKSCYPKIDDCAVCRKKIWRKS